VNVLAKGEGGLKVWRREGLADVWERMSVVWREGWREEEDD
jgi:hypothetical protein